MRGREEIAEYIRDWVRTVAGLRIDAARDIDAGDAVVSLGTVSGRAGEDGPEVAVPIAFVTYFDGGQAVRTEEYLDHGKALAAVGLSEQDVHADS